ncbi:2-oxo acid dehydrogenase subunit E2 [Planctomycetota bacterium]
MDKELSTIQKIIGKRMLLSKRTKPCFYLEAKADVTELMAIRPKLRKRLGVKITTNVFYIRALAMAVEKYPEINARLDGDVIMVAGSVNVGFAVSAPQGLVVPVVKDASEKGLVEIAGDEKLLTEKALDNQLTLEDMESETVALSNLGPYGIDSFIGIIPPVASVILATGRVIPTIICRDGEPVSRKMLSLSLAVDHKIINGYYAAQFLNYLKELLENPQELV